MREHQYNNTHLGGHLLPGGRLITLGPSCNGGLCNFSSWSRPLFWVWFCFCFLACQASASTVICQVTEYIIHCLIQHCFWPKNVLPRQRRKAMSWCPCNPLLSWILSPRSIWLHRLAEWLTDGSITVPAGRQYLQNSEGYAPGSRIWCCSPIAGVQWSNTNKGKVRRSYLINIPNGHFCIFDFLDPLGKRK